MRKTLNNLSDKSGLRAMETEPRDLSSISPVDRVFVMMVSILDYADQDMILAEMHNKGNRLTAAHMRALELIDLYNIDPPRFGAISTLKDIEKILLEVID